jgi:DNA-binding MarR family transcriptional regulator
VNPSAVSSFKKASEADRPELIELELLQEQFNRLRFRLEKPQPVKPRSLEPAMLLPLVKEILRSRRQRDSLFGTELFGEPAWDILLELFVAEQTYRKLSVSSVCLASAVPPSTAIRWIERLESAGWVRRDNDPLDRRRIWVLLTPKGSDAMLAYLQRVSFRPA